MLGSMSCCFLHGPALACILPLRTNRVCTHAVLGSLSTTHACALSQGQCITGTGGGSCYMRCWPLHAAACAWRHVSPRQHAQLAAHVHAYRAHHRLVCSPHTAYHTQNTRPPHIATNQGIARRLSSHPMIERKVFETPYTHKHARAHSLSHMHTSSTPKEKHTHNKAYCSILNKKNERKTGHFVCVEAASMPTEITTQVGMPLKIRVRARPWLRST